MFCMLAMKMYHLSSISPSVRLFFLSIHITGTSPVFSFLQGDLRLIFVNKRLHFEFNKDEN
jgi:hypothetical protein